MHRGYLWAIPSESDNGCYVNLTLAGDSIGAGESTDGRAVPPALTRSPSACAARWSPERFGSRGECGRRRDGRRLKDYLALRNSRMMISSASITSSRDARLLLKLSFRL